jgi:hypothetical protein
MVVFVKITEQAQIIGQLFSTVKVMYSFSQKMEMSTVWVTFSQTHPVTLNVSHELCLKVERQIFVFRPAKTQADPNIEPVSAPSK